MFKHQYNLKASSRSYTHASSLTLDGTLFFPPILDTHNDSSTYYLFKTEVNPMSFFIRKCLLVYSSPNILGYRPILCSGLCLNNFLAI